MQNIEFVYCTLYVLVVQIVWVNSEVFHTEGALIFVKFGKHIGGGYFEMCLLAVKQ